MCGIAGVYFKKEVDNNTLQRFENIVNESQFGRGPDQFNKKKVLPNLFFYHNMLSIIDIGNASQPMEDEKGVITYNGELYNYKELKYPNENYRLKSDTEVMLKGLNNEYIDFINKTNSMFGLGYYNKQSMKLTLIRDRVGIKPVYYIDTEEVFAFASTLKPLVIFSEKRLNYTKFWQYYLNRAFKAPDTIFEDIKKLPSAAYLEFDVNDNRIAASGSYWERHQLSSRYSDEDEVIDTLEQIINDSLRNRLVADVPVGVFLSGGVDSSLIAALTSQLTSNLNAFTVSFYDPQFDESKYAKKVCELFGIKYNEVKVNGSDFLKSIDQWINIQDDIVADPSALALYKIASFANSMNYRALLAGEGADELFAGYNSYKYFSWSQRIYKSGGLLAPFKKSLAGLYRKDSKKYHFILNSLRNPKFHGTALIFEPHLLARLIDDFSPDDIPVATSLKEAMDLDIKDRLPNDLLMRSDRATMGTSIECRVPFLAHQLVDYSAQISENLFLKNKTPKYLIKKLASKHIPEDIIYREKVGFDLPLESWISNELKDLFTETIESSIQKDYLNMNVIRTAFDSHVNHGIDHSDKLWAFLCLELSYRNLKDIH